MSLERQVEAYLKAFEKKRLVKPTRCEVCGGTGPLHWHAVYRRSLIAFHQTVVLPVNRVFCASCRKTFASLPDFIVKFHRYARPVILFALRCLKRLSFNATADLLMDRTSRAVVPFTLFLWRRRFARSPA